MLTKVEDKRWEVVYENVYGRWSFRENLKKLDFYSIMGNHDHKGNQTAQLMYSQFRFQICFFFIISLGSFKNCLKFLSNFSQRSPII